MRDARWHEVGKSLESGLRNLEIGVSIFDQGDLDRDDIEGDKSRMALMHALQSGYTSIETMFQRILSILDEVEPTGPDWHAALLDRVSSEMPGDRSAIIGSQLYRDLHHLRRFRHVATRNYDNFVPENATEAVDAARRVQEQLRGEIEAFKQSMDPSDRPHL